MCFLHLHTSLFRLATSRVAHGYCVKAGSVILSCSSGRRRHPSWTPPSLCLVTCSEDCPVATILRLLRFASQLAPLFSGLQALSSPWWFCSATVGRGLPSACPSLDSLWSGLAAHLLELLRSCHPGASPVPFLVVDPCLFVCFPPGYLRSFSSLVFFLHSGGNSSDC